MDVAWSNTVTPVMSLGKRSGVNWIRFQVRLTDLQMARAREVLPTPGTSSISRWPSARTHVSAARTTLSLPCRTLVTLDDQALEHPPEERYVGPAGV